MDYFIICIVSLLGSGLTLFSGFGLGTILLPVFALFFPVEIAITLTAIVHFLNNIFKLVLLGKYADKK
ncbi:MAG: sulfite exporter TauE/SafE family protein, partial [Flavobacterium sp.]